MLQYTERGGEGNIFQPLGGYREGLLLSVQVSRARENKRMSETAEHGLEEKTTDKRL